MDLWDITVMSLVLLLKEAMKTHWVDINQPLLVPQKRAAMDCFSTTVTDTTNKSNLVEERVYSA